MVHILLECVLVTNNFNDDCHSFRLISQMVCRESTIFLSGSFQGENSVMRVRLEGRKGS